MTFPWVEEVIDVQAIDGQHVDNVEITRVLSAAYLRYLQVGLGLPSEVLDDPNGRPIVRSINVRFDREVFAGDVLRCGVRAVSRRRRAFTLEQQLWRVADERTLAVGIVVFVTIDTVKREAVPVPDRLWDAVERYEQRPIAIDVDA